MVTEDGDVGRAEGTADGLCCGAAVNHLCPCASEPFKAELVPCGSCSTQLLLCAGFPRGSSGVGAADA